MVAGWQDGRTPLFRSSWNGRHVEVVKALIDKGANIEAKDNKVSMKEALATHADAEGLVGLGLIKPARVWRVMEMVC